VHPVQLSEAEMASDENTHVDIKPRKNEGKCSLGLSKLGALAW
jgi:hypothetical protein